MSLENTYARLSQIPGVEVEPLEIIATVEQYRHFWKPEKVRVILLAESYVYTTVADFNCRLQPILRQKPGMERYPDNYARVVYCLGYGEDELLVGPISKNSGTPQFWKIFYSCEFRINGNNDFAPILKTATPFGYRIRNKIRLLERLKESGVWLLDASIMTLYGRNTDLPTRTQERVIATCWDSYIKPIIEDTHPQHLVCIGMGVANALQNRLSILSRNIKVSRYVIPQPQAHLAAEEHIRNFQRYYDICHDGKSM